MDRKGNVLLEQRTTIILQYKKKSTVSGERYDKKLRDNEIRIIQFLIQFLKDEIHSRYRFDWSIKTKRKTTKQKLWLHLISDGFLLFFPIFFHFLFSFQVPTFDKTADYFICFNFMENLFTVHILQNQLFF